MQQGHSEDTSPLPCLQGNLPYLVCKLMQNSGKWGLPPLLRLSPPSPMENQPAASTGNNDSQPITLADLNAALTAHFAAFSEQHQALRDTVQDLAAEQRQLRSSVDSLQSSTDRKVHELAEEQKALRSSVDNSVLGLASKVDSMDSRLREVENALAKTQAELVVPSRVGLAEDEIVVEVEERTRRAKNVLFFDIPEPADADPARVAEILTPLSLPAETYTLSRLGRTPPLVAGHKPRPLLVSFTTRENARQVLQRKASLTLGGKTVAVRGDETNKQRESLKQARAQLEERRKAGEEDLTIRFVGGVPRVVLKGDDEKKKRNSRPARDGGN